jgi:tetratricopeptide (TPR) repeat protein
VTLAPAVPIAVSVVLPGLGQVVAGRTLRGLALFFLFGCAADGYFYSQALRILPPEVAPVAPGLVRTLSLVGGGLVWLVAFADVVRLASRNRRIRSRAAEATAHIRKGLIAYLRHDLPAATRAFLAALRIDDRDPDALYHLGVAYAAAGQRRKARRALRRCVRFDADGKWDIEAQAHLHALDAPPQPAEPPPEPQEEDHGEA